MNLSLENKNAVVCGSSQGIGLAIAQELALLGATCILLARNEAELKKAVTSLSTEHQQQHQYAVADFSKSSQVKKAIDEIVNKNPVHILINNTGGPAAGPIIKASAADFINAFEQHLICNHILAQAVLPGMKTAGYGRIINIISTSVKTPLKNLGVSNAIRWAVAAWAKTLATEIAVSGITVNNILPGSTRTSRLDSLFTNTAKEKNTTYEEIKKQWLQEIPMKRFAEPAEIAALAAFLASPAASYITGTNIQADGGKTPVG